MADIFIGNIKGPQGDTGPQGNQGEKGDAATIRVGSVTTTQYGQTARVTNSGTEHDAVFDFVIPQGRPGEQVTRMDNLLLDALTEPSASFPVPAIGDNGSTLFGKISKWFSDMSALVATKFNAANVINNLTTTSSGYALDARQGKALNNALNTTASLVDGNFAEQSIISYQSASNVFTAPSDGYVMVNHNVSSVNAGSTINVFINGKTLISLFARGYGSKGSIFVKKNAKIYHTQTGFTAGTNYWIMFYPFTYMTR